MAPPVDTFASFVDSLAQNLDDHGARGEDLAARVHLSRFHFDRVVSAVSGENRGGWQAASRFSAQACSSSARSLSSRIISTWHSGSPKRALYSISFGPSRVSIRPA